MDSGDITIQELPYPPSNQSSFTVDFFGDDLKVTLTSTPSVVRKWIVSICFLYRDFRHKLVVGLGVQWDSSESEPASTLQLCVGRRCLVFQLAHADYVPNALRRFLNDPNITFVGIWNHSDAHRLRNSDHELKMSSPPLDLRYTAADKYDDRSLLSSSMETLVSTVLGLEGVTKEYDVRRSNWNADILSDEQVLYAAVDAYVSFQMGKDMSVWCSDSSGSYSDSDSDPY